MSIPVSIDPLGTLGAREPVPALAESVVVPRRCCLAIPLYGLREFVIEFTTNFSVSNAYNIITGAFGFIGYGFNTDPGWVVYRSYSGQSEGHAERAIKPQPYRIEARERSFSAQYVSYGKVTHNVTGDLRAPDLVLAYISPTTPEREVDIPLIGAAFVVKKIDETLVHDFRFRADGKGFYDMVEGKNYYFAS